MKNCLYTLLSLAVGLGVSYADTVASFDFESRDLRLGIKPYYGLDDNGNSDKANTYWFFTGADGENECSIESYYTSEARYDGYDDETNPRPAYQHEATNNFGCLRIVTSNDALLWRHFNRVFSASGKSKATVIPDTGLFFDAQMRLDPYDTDDYPPSISLFNAAGGKIALWLDCTGGGSVGDIRVMAGSVQADGSLVTTNYTTTARLGRSEWIRVTIRSFNNIATMSTERDYVGFAVYVNGKLLVCEGDDAKYPIGAGRNRFQGNELYEKHALFPSAVLSESNGGTSLSAIGGTGKGDIDDFALVTENPFALATNEVEVTVVCDNDRLTALAYEIVRGSSVVTNELTWPFNGTKFTVCTNDTVKFLPAPADKQFLGSGVQVSGNHCYDEVDGFTIAFKSVFYADGGLAVTIPVYGANFLYGGREYATFNAIVDEVAETGMGNGEVVTLNQNVELDKDYATENGRLWVKPGVDLKLDLKGNRIHGTHYREEAAVYAQGSLVIYDSVGGGSIVAPGNTLEVQLNNDAAEARYASARLQLGEDGYPELFFVTGVVKCTEGKLTVMGGQYANPGGVASDEFYLASYVPADGRFTVEPVDGKRGYAVRNEGNNHLVTFEVEHGKVNPTNYLVVADGEVIDQTKFSVDAPGYSLKWYHGDEVYDFTQPVTSNMTLSAKQSVIGYSIEYHDHRVNGTYRPIYYTAEDAYTELPVPTTDKLEDFVHWCDRDTGHGVNAVGKGAKFIGTDTTVTGDLVLDAVWTPRKYTWTNAGAGLVESNGVYGGSWSFEIPREGDIKAGQKLKINTISFSVVNPVTYPKTAPYLFFVTNSALPAVVSEMWDAALYLDAENEYQVDETKRLGNDRPQVVYNFTNLVITAGATYTIRFAADESGAAAEGFVRLVPASVKTPVPVIGACDTNEAVSVEYGNYRPVYEVKGESCND